MSLADWCERVGIPVGPDGKPDRAACAARGIRLTEDGLPRRAEKPGPAKPCSRCGVPVEDPVESNFVSFDSTRPAIPMVVCQGCMDLVWADELPAN